jgi:hypothetical protein
LKRQKEDIAREIKASHLSLINLYNVNYTSCL